MASAKEFIEAYSPYALYVQERYGIPYGVVLAQAALESDWGESSLAKKAMNFFGIKAGSSWEGETVIMPTTEVINGKSVKVAGVFRAYDDPLASFSDYGRLLASNPRYAAVLAADDPYEAAEALERAGYATDPMYAEKLKAIIKKYDLDKPYKGKSWFDRIADWIFPVDDIERDMKKRIDEAREKFKQMNPGATDEDFENFIRNMQGDMLKTLDPAVSAKQIWNDIKSVIPRFLVIVGTIVLIVVVVILALRGGKE